MKPIFNYFEKTLILLSILSLLLLLAIQYINYTDNDIILTYMNNKDSKFFPIANSAESFDKGIIILKNMTPNYNNIEVLVNGEYIGDFVKNDELKVGVYNNDLIEIDGTKYNNQLKIKVVGISNNIIIPKLDTVITTSQSIEILSNVKLK
ncbi:hypothetical protein CULT_1050016 [[Clostridium] ultunense Esp]|uniref:Uncharacterized protein n=1 Tax=[Clostridium] ultunense Esp TaxID=1288971 RepID=M1Z4J5_9FIRM|nr:hypothetical protein [Schnuerera ultunensis]CCQ92674.1 hypothetical protein CULT_1050016 [[Clostridium] ultunense Esp]SHD77115.1 conserved protein of unknown function [[Clostridium] ultunense Esp]